MAENENLIESVECVLVASDLHCGGVGALMRSGFVTSEGNEIGLNPFQRWLEEQYFSCLEEVDRLADGRKFLVVFNGDLIEGNHHRTTEITAIKASDHLKMCIHAIQPILDRASYVAIVEGTECHTGDYEAEIGRIVGSLQDPMTGAHSFRELSIEVHGCLGQFRHHMPTTKRVYLESSGLGIELGNAQVASARVRQRVPQFICSAHRHRPGVYTDGQALFVCTPAWQGLTRYARKVVPDGKITPGFAWLDWRGKELGDIPDARLIVRRPCPNPVVKL